MGRDWRMSFMLHVVEHEWLGFNYSDVEELTFDSTRIDGLEK